MNADERRLNEANRPSSVYLFCSSNLRASAFICGCLLLSTTGCGWVGEYFSGNTPIVNDRKMNNVDNPDDRREGMIYLADHDYGRKPPYTTQYKLIAKSDPDPLVRATAVRSLNIARDKTATPIFIAALSDTSPLVRLEGAKALYRVPDANAATRLLSIATDDGSRWPPNDPRHAGENKDIRIAATEALQHYRQLDVARQLVSLLNQKDFAIAWQARRTLKRLTGKDLNYDESAWLQYITGPSKPLG